MAWFLLLLAGMFEVIWAGMLRYTEGFTRILPTAGVLVAMAGSTLCLALAVRTVPLGTAYAVWCGFGILGTTIIGIWLNGESSDPLRLLCIGLIGAGVIGLKFAG